jgi:hypothetical protein
MRIEQDKKLLLSATLSPSQQTEARTGFLFHLDSQLAEHCKIGLLLKKSAADAGTDGYEVVLKDYITPKQTASPSPPQPGAAAGKSRLESTGLLSDEFSSAAFTFDSLMQGSEAEWDLLIELLHNHPVRYAALMAEHKKQQNERGAPPDTRFTEYLYSRIESSQEFAREHARAWKSGWNKTAADMLATLRVKFPSSRRVAIEFLKMENNEQDFGYDWNSDPETPQNKAAIGKWEQWVKERKQPALPK